jgi:hypothetical protein
MKEQKLLGALLPSSPDFAPIIESVKEKYNLHEVDPDSEAIKEIYLGDESYHLQNSAKTLKTLLVKTWLLCRLMSCLKDNETAFVLSHT